jgi:hypothetical protein
LKDEYFFVFPFDSQGMHACINILYSYAVAVADGIVHDLDILVEFDVH